MKSNCHPFKSRKKASTGIARRSSAPHTPDAGGSSFSKNMAKAICRYESVYVGTRVLANPGGKCGGGGRLPYYPRMTYDDGAAAESSQPPSPPSYIRSPGGLYFRNSREFLYSCARPREETKTPERRQPHVYASSSYKRRTFEPRVITSRSYSLASELSSSPRRCRRAAGLKYGAPY